MHRAIIHNQVCLSHVKDGEYILVTDPEIEEINIHLSRLSDLEAIMHDLSGQRLKTLIKLLIQHASIYCNNNKTEMAQYLGICKASLGQYIRWCNTDCKNFKEVKR